MTSACVLDPCFLILVASLSDSGWWNMMFAARLDSTCYFLPVIHERINLVRFFPLNINMVLHSPDRSRWPLLWLFRACRGDSLWLWSVALVSDVWVCFIYSAEPRCRCAGLFHGTRCELTDNPCASQPCTHGRVCMPMDQGYLCNCSLDNRDAR